MILKCEYSIPSYVSEELADLISLLLVRDLESRINIH